MDAGCFYTSSAPRAVLLVLIGKKEWDAGTISLTAIDATRLELENFQGNIGDLATIYDNNGQLIKAYIGNGNGDDSVALATTLTRLPATIYHVKSCLSKDAYLAWALAQYRFDKFKVNLLTPRVLLVDKKALVSILIEAQALFLVRDLINRPASDLGPSQLAEEMERIAVRFEGDYEAIVGEELLANNYPAIHAVGRAASVAPRLLSLTWGKLTHPKITLVGKGVCFDSGGLDIKPSSAMRTMKKDMGGAAHVLGLAYWIMAKKIPVRLCVLIPAVENVISSNAYRPGDVLTMRNQLTVEIDNTDAEGRLVLADALVKACEECPELIIDYATLTGAARVAVGTDIAAMFTNNDEVANALAQASIERADPVWRMPLYSGYNNLFESSIADMANASSSPYAGAITAALFLQYFVKANIPWVHFDIMAWNVVPRPGKPDGGEAMAVKAVAHYLEQRYCH